MQAVRARRVGAAAAVAAGIAAAAVSAAVSTRTRPDAFVLRNLVADPGYPAAVHDAQLVNAWGLAASASGPWWTANEARGTSTLYAANGRKQALTVSVPGGPTGVAWNGGPGFPVRGGSRSAPARFVYACEDGMIRAWSPTVPDGWSTRTEVVVDGAGTAAVFKGVAFATLPDGSRRLYATDFHNGRVLAFDSRWRPVALRGGFRDPSIPDGYAPFNVLVSGGRVFVSYARPAPVTGNDSPTGGYVDEFDLAGRLLARVGRAGPLDEPWGLAVAPHGFGALGGALLVGNFGSGRINAYVRRGGGWAYRGQLQGRDGKPLVVPGLWGIAFGTGGMSGPRTTLFVAAGPHRWHGASELAVHGLLGAVAPAA
jgi:uncharacterized protein (TIGR03118 family)